ncbi:DUF2169 family type VI secretion system accessory protein [Sorangium sp. So ce1153]|uniref:DUF2169 family type VI secretion system accessory protein n=1 Tax=Sorangium sp. So ce1153 TaxID=3133333 RepID=UPI003F5DFD1E
MSLLNATSYPALDVPYVDPSGQRVVIAIIKATFELSRTDRLVPSAEPSPVRVADVLWDEQRPQGSVKYPSDVCCAKRGADVVVVGAAISPRSVARMDVLVRVGALEAPLVVHGERFFVKGARGVVIGPAAPFEAMPVVYDRAYGGMTADCALAEERNPAGVGVAHRDKDLLDTPAPQIEHPAFPHTRAGEDHAPVGYGATRSHWMPRRSYAGTFDATWKKARMPLLPLDYDPRFENVAHPSLQLKAPPPPGTEIAVLGMSERGLFRCELPDTKLVVHGIRGQERTTVRPVVDTVLIEPARGRVELVHRAVFTMGRGRTLLREIRVDTDA